MATATQNASTPRERKPSTSAPITDFQGPVGPHGITRPKHKRTVTGFGPQEIKAVEASIPEHLREAWKKYVSLDDEAYTIWPAFGESSR